MVYARKPLIYAGLLNTMVTQSYLNNLIETCPQITRNAVVRKGTWVRIPPLPSDINNAILSGGFSYRKTQPLFCRSKIV